MSSLFERYPRVGEAFIVLLIAIIGWFLTETVRNNTTAMEKLTTTMDSIAREVQGNKIKLAEHELRINMCEGN